MSFERFWLQLTELTPGRSWHIDVRRFSQTKKSIALFDGSLHVKPLGLQKESLWQLGEQRRGAVVGRRQR